MRILHVISTLNPASGGPPIVCGAIAAAQAQLGHSVTVITYTDPKANEYFPKVFAPMPGWDKVKLVLVDQPGRIENYTGRRAAAALKPLVPNHDFVHIHSVWEPILVQAASQARRHRVPYCVLLNGMLDPWSLSQRKLKKQLCLALIHRRMLSGAAFLHTLNKDEETLLSPLNLPTPLARIPNGVFLTDIDPLPPRGQLRAKFPQLADKPFILFLSRLHYKKGLDILADAFARVAPVMPDLQLVVAGPDGGDRQPLLDRVAAAGLASRVHVVGPLYGRDKISAMVDAACFCLPSRQEGFSLAITEALACACPVVITENCHFPEVAEVGAGRVVPLDPVPVADALLDVLRDQPAAARMGQAGRTMIESRFTWPRIAQRTLDCYQQYSAKGTPASR